MESLSYCVNVDRKLYEMLSCPNLFEQLIGYQKHEDNRNKKNQVVILQEYGVGVITSEQSRIVAIFDNSNPSLGILLSKSTIIIEVEERKLIPSYEVVSIRFNLTNDGKKFTRTLGKCLLIANGIEFKREDVPHHKRHPMINMLGDVEKVTNSENPKLKPDFYHQSECSDYIMKNILKTDEAGYEKFIHNIQFITRLNSTCRGIYVSGFPITKVQVNSETYEFINIETSRM